MRANSFASLVALSSAVLLVGCKGGLAFTRSSTPGDELAAAAAERRFGSVVERAAALENQHAKSRDVYWYRAWRGAAMIGLGQVGAGEAVIDEVLAEIGKGAAKVTEPGKLRVFLLDQKATAALARNRPDLAVNQLVRALSLAPDTPMADAGKCGRKLMLAARHHQLSRVAASAGDDGNHARSKDRAQRFIDDWVVCLAAADYPSMHMIAALAGPLGSGARAPIAVAAPAKEVEEYAPPPPPRAKPPPPKPRRAPPPPPPKPVAQPDPEPEPEPKRSVRPKRSSATYAPVDAAVWQPHLDVLVKLLRRRNPSAQGGVAIRTDGQKRALQIKLDGPSAQPKTLVPLFRNTVLFFENTKSIDPAIQQVLIVMKTKDGIRRVLADRGDVVDLFVDRIDVETFLSRMYILR